MFDKLSSYHSHLLLIKDANSQFIYKCLYSTRQATVMPIFVVVVHNQSIEGKYILTSLINYHKHIKNCNLLLLWAETCMLSTTLSCTSLSSLHSNMQFGFVMHVQCTIGLSFLHCLFTKTMFFVRVLVTQPDIPLVRHWLYTSS